ncbi:beta-sandwich domain-containing protein [Bdellovibrio sp. BCCA]|uniref:beta-sandwich domain-containing protein n=1 Tax=Bdellovibrio sp. BCCA TaxID=3136281 RepID=UPI0030F0833B
MKRRLIASVLAALSFAQNSAYADLTDLPSFDGVTEQLPPIPSQPTATSQNTGTVQTQFAGSVALSGMSRKSGGTLYKVELKQALSLIRLDVRVTVNQLKILQTTLVTDAGQRIDVRQLKNTSVLATDSLTSFENLNQSDRIASIELLAESFGGEADIMLTAVGDREVPKMTVTVDRPATTIPSANSDGDNQSVSVRPTPPPPPVPARPRDTVIRTGDRVYYSNSVGEVRSIFSNGKAVVARDGYYDVTVDLRDLAKSISCVGKICVKDDVLFENTMGYAKEVFSNGKVRLIRNGYYDTFVEASSLAKYVKCLGSLCEGDAVIFSGTSGKVTALYDNGKVLLERIGYYDTFVDYRSVAKATSCSSTGTVCVGDTVYYQGSVGKIRTIYANNQALLDRNGYYPTYVDTSALAKSVRCLGALCLGARVYFSSSVGTVAAIFANGKVLLQRAGYYDTFADSVSLSRSVQCERVTGICAGDTVIFSNTMGLVAEIFENGQALFVRSGYYDTFVDAKLLAKKIR